MLQFIDSVRFMASIECIELNVNTDMMMMKNVKLVELNISIATGFKDDLIEYKCLCYKKNNQHKFDEKLKE